MTGIPVDVPDPRNVIFMRANSGVSRSEKAETGQPLQLHKLILPRFRRDGHGFAGFVPGGKDGHGRGSCGNDGLVMKVSEDDHLKSLGSFLPSVPFHQLYWQPALVLEVRSRQPLLRFVDELSEKATKVDWQER